MPKESNMDIDELFIDENNLPTPLTKEELDALMKQVSLGSQEARNEILIHNIRFVLYRVSKFSNINYDKRDLVSVGIIGLIKSIDTYKPNKNTQFLTYASRCIDNEILMFIRKINNSKKNNIVFMDENDNEKLLDDIFVDKKNFVEDFIHEETKKDIAKIVQSLPDRDREIIMLRFGFYDDHIYTQQEISDRIGVSQRRVSSLISKVVKKIGKELEKEKIIELHSKQEAIVESSQPNKLPNKQLVKTLKK